jgi:hypothetical protein
VLRSIKIVDQGLYRRYIDVSGVAEVQSAVLRTHMQDRLFIGMWGATVNHRGSRAHILAAERFWQSEEAVLKR